MTTPSTLPRAWLAVLALLTAVGPLSVDLYLPTLPAMAGEFGADASRMQLTLLGFMVGMAVGQLVGPLSDRWGRHRLLIAGTLLSTAAGAACALAPSLEVLVGCRILQGLGGAAGVVLSRAIVADRSEGASAAGAFSLMMIINGAAPIVAPLIGGSVAGIIGWRGIFWILAALSALMVLGATIVLSETCPAAARSERAGAGILGVLGNRSFLGCALTFAFGFSVMFAFISASPFVLQNVLGLSPVGIGIAVAAIAFGLLALNAGTRASWRGSGRPGF
ncbi:MFS transporter [Mycobacterium sp. PSTR-4-N]|uniref:MFS transporter n=1 Tax=Mycobacterium sp. PSTR-4-N TaxID=2917745 RepID=UPI0027DF4CF1|nr:MFS transporter [Mycobacterium sp. PSTR-4-N]